MISPGLSRQRTVSLPHDALETARIMTVRGPSALTAPDTSCQRPESVVPEGSWAAAGVPMTSRAPVHHAARHILRLPMFGRWKGNLVNDPGAGDRSPAPGAPDSGS